MFGRLLTRILTFLFRLLSFLPFRVLYLLSDLTFLMLYHVFRYRRTVVKDNLLHSFPLKTKEQRLDIERKYYHFLADLMVECIKMISLPRYRAFNHFRVENPELLEKYFSQGKSVLAVGGHYGNWEMASIMGLSTNRPKFVIYKPLTNKIMNRFLNGVRSRFDATMIPMKNVIRILAEFRNRPTMSFFVTDQTPAITELNYFTLFFNQKTAFFLGTEKIAKATNTPVIFCDVTIVKRGYYSVNFIPLFEDPQSAVEFEITETYIQYLERMILRAPQYWLWSHKRWKYSPAHARSPIFSESLRAAGMDS